MLRQLSVFVSRHLSKSKWPTYAKEWPTHSSLQKESREKKYELHLHYLGKLVLTEVHVPQVDQALQATRYVVQGALRVPAHRYKF